MPGILLHSARDFHGVVDRNVRGCRDICQSPFLIRLAQILLKAPMPNFSMLEKMGSPISRAISVALIAHYPATKIT